ncbi:MAG: matrixin family metalloprotease [Myxococcota bacterium]
MSVGLGHGLRLASSILLPSAILLLGAGDAAAYRCSRVDDDSGSSLSWSTRTVNYIFFEGGTSDIPGEDEFEAVRDGFAVWENLVTDPEDNCAPAEAMTDFRWIESPQRSSVDRIGYNFLDQDDNENLVIFRDDEWPYPGQENTVIALSTVTFNAVTGEILDADIEFNSAGFQFTTRDDNPVTDVLNTAVHEIGHSMGIAHTSDPNASMFLQASPGQTIKRDLNCDDRAAMAFKYPSGEMNGYCDPPVESCGFCAPPGQLEAQIVATEVASGDDVGGCSCRSSPAVFGWLAAASFWLLLRHCRRRSS